MALTKVTSSVIEPGSIEASSLEDSGVTSGQYGSASAIPVLTVNQQGLVTAVSTTSVEGLPDQTGESGNYLTTDGTTASWSTITQYTPPTDQGAGNFLAGDGTYKAVTVPTNVSELTNDSGYITGYTVTESDVTAHQAALSITESQISDFGTYNNYTDTDVASYLSANDFDTATNIIASITDSAPAALDTLNELSAALGDDANFAATVSTNIGTKVDKTTTISAGTALTGGGSLEANRTISHVNVTRSNTTDSDTLSHSGTFTAITGLTSNAQGHVTGAETTTYTLPAGAVPNNATITVAAGTDLSTGGNFTTDQGTNETITINHSNITRTNTTSSASPSAGGTVDVVNSVSTNARGHVTGVDVKTITLPADTNTWRPIHDSPVDGATTTSISSNWAYDNVKTAVPSGAVFTDTVYTHPTYAGDDFSIDTGTLTGATVISDIDINVTTDTQGHVTDANATVATRDLTLANLGYTGATNANYFTYTHPSHPGDDINLDTGVLSGATVISDLDFNVTTDTQGHVTDANATYSTRNLTLADLGFTGETNATADQTITAGSGLTGGGTGNVTLSHADTSSQSSVNNSGSTFIQDITLDTYGHVTGLGSTTLGSASLLDANTATTDDLNSENKVIRSGTNKIAASRYFHANSITLQPLNTANYGFTSDSSGGGCLNTFSSGYGNGVYVTAWRHQTAGSQTFSYPAMFYNKNNSQVGYIFINNSGTSYGTSSDYRLKENVVPLEGASDRLKQIPVHRFNFLADPDRTVDGFLAHEVQEYVPEAVVGEKDEVDEDGNPFYQAIDQSKLVPLLTAALQDAITKIEELETRLNNAGI